MNLLLTPTTLVSCIIILCYSILFISNRCVCHDRISTMGCLSAMCVCFRSKKKNKKYSGLFYIRISSSFNSCLFVSVSWNELSFILNTILSRPPQLIVELAARPFNRKWKWYKRRTSATTLHCTTHRQEKTFSGWLITQQQLQNNITKLTAAPAKKKQNKNNKNIPCIKHLQRFRRSPSSVLCKLVNSR